MLVKTTQNNIRQDKCRKFEYTIDRIIRGECLKVFMYRMRKYYHN